MIPLVYAALILAPLPNRQTLLTWAAETEASITRRYLRPDKTYRLSVKVDGAPVKGDAFAWDLAVLLSAYSAGLAAKTPTARAGFLATSHALESYRTKDGKGEGFAVLPHQSPPDRFYDDNAWIALAYVEAYEASHNREWLDRCIETFKFVSQGESPDLGGGLFWRETPRAEKNTCTNAPAIQIALRLYRATKDPVYLADADRWLKWTTRLQDEDGLYFDHISLHGKIDRTKWTYNSALMIRDYALRYELLHDQADREQALRIGKASVERWREPNGAIKDEASFAHHLAEAWLELGVVEPNGPWRSYALQSVERVHELARSPLGLYGLYWDRFQLRDGKANLLQQASALRAFWRSAESPK